jgi:hypothetical protein
MRAPTIEKGGGRHLPDHLDDHLHEWMDRDLITAAEADRIARFEASRVTPRRIPAAAEIVGYLGAVLVFAAGAAVYIQGFEDMSHVARVGVPALATVLAFVAGILLVRNAEATFRRLGAVLWTASVALLAATLGIAFGDRDVVPDYSVFAVGTSCLVYAAVLYGFIRHGATQAAMFAATIATVAGGFAWARPDGLEGSAVALAGALLAIGLAWVAAGAWDRLIPRDEAILLGSALALYSPTFLSVDVSWLALALGIVVSVGLLAASTWLRSTPVLLLSGVALFGYLVATITRYLADSLGAPVALAASGLVLIGVAIVVSRLRRFARPSQSGPPAEA